MTGLKAFVSWFEGTGALAPWCFLGLFILASFLMIWRLEAMTQSGVEGTVLGTLVNFTCHPALHDRIRLKTWSADFPGVIAEQLAQAYGKQAICVFTQGCSGNIQPPVTFTPDWRERAAVFARAAVDAAKGATPIKGPIAVGFARRDVTVPCRNPAAEVPVCRGLPNLPAYPQA